MIEFGILLVLIAVALGVVCLVVPIVQLVEAARNLRQAQADSILERAGLLVQWPDDDGELG